MSPRSAIQPLAALVAGFCLAGIPSALSAPVVTTAISGPNNPSTATDELTFAADVSSTDLLHGILGTGGTWKANGSGPDGLNDGLPGGDVDASGLAALNGATWAEDGGTLSFRIFELGTGGEGAGHDITSIQSIAAWQGAGFSNQSYEVRVRLLGNAAFETAPLAVVNYQPFSAAGTEGGSTRVRVTDSTGVLASGVTAIRFDIRDTTGNPAGGSVYRELDVFGTPTASGTDNVPPVLVSRTPADDRVKVATGSVLKAEFDENIVLGSGTITIKNNFAASQTVITLPDPRVTVSGKNLIIRPGAVLTPNAHHSIRLSPGCVADTSGNPFAGIETDTGWDLVTAELTSMEATVENLGFAGDVSGHDLVNGMAAVVTGWNYNNNSLPSKLNDGAHGLDFATAGGVQGAWTTVGSTAEFNLGTGPNGTGYDVFSIQSIASWENASFGNQAWTLEVKPVGGSYSVLRTVDYQPILGGGATRVVVNGSLPVLAAGIEAIRITVQGVNNGANGGAFVWRELDVFGQAAEPDIGPPDETPPALVSLSPADNATSVLPGAKLTVVFNENITTGSGSVRLRNLDTSVETAIPTGDPRITLSGTTMNITPSPKLAPNTRYAIRIDPGAIRDLRSNVFAGITDDTTWNFTTTSAPLRIMPMGDSITAGYTDNPNWNEPFWYGYRSGLYNRLHNAGYNFIFTGQSTELKNHVSGTTPPADLAALGQASHNGYGGQAAGFLNANILNWLATDEPDVILLKIGTNSQDTAGLDTLVNTILTNRPGLHLIVARIIPKYSYQQGVVDYNDWIRDTLVPKYKNQGKNISLVDQYVNFLTNPSNPTSINQALFSNGINHPNNAGYDKMAETWFQGIEALGLNTLTFQAWIENPAFGIPAGARAFSDDPDGDGLKNGVEAWLGTDPGRSNPAFGNLTVNGTGFSLSHSVNSREIANLAATYEWSRDMTTWYKADGIAGPGSGLKVVCTPVVSGTTATVQATPNQPVDRIFLRLSVSSE